MRLGDITEHALWYECVCGQQARFRVSELIVRVGPDEQCADVMRRVRCSKCRGRAMRRWLVSYNTNVHG